MKDAADVSDRARRRDLRRRGRFVAINIGGNEADALRMSDLAGAAQKAGIRFEQHVWGETLTQSQCLDLVAQINEDQATFVAVIQPSVPDHIDHAALLDQISEAKQAGIGAELLGRSDAAAAVLMADAAARTLVDA